MIEGIKPKNIIRVLAVVMEIMCFVPVFLVSCDGGKVTEVCMKTAITGHEEAGIEADMLYIWAFIIPVLIFGIWFFKERLQEIVIRVIVLALASMDIALWVSFKNQIIEIADNNYCEFETTSAYTANFIFLGLVCLLAVVDICVIIYMKRSKIDIKMNNVETKGYNIRSSIKNMTNIVDDTVKVEKSAAAEVLQEQCENTQTVKYDGFCWQCGKQIEMRSNFCSHCGAAKE